jgi:aconitase B
VGRIIEYYGPGLACLTEPLIAMPSSPGNVRPVSNVSGEPIYQTYVGSSANPGYRDFAVAAKIVRGLRVHPNVSFDVNPTSRQILENLIRNGHLSSLIHAVRVIAPSAQMIVTRSEPFVPAPCRTVTLAGAGAVVHADGVLSLPTLKRRFYNPLV